MKQFADKSFKIGADALLKEIAYSFLLTARVATSDPRHFPQPIHSVCEIAFTQKKGKTLI